MDSQKEEDDSQDYSWDYDDDNGEKQKALGKKQLISLTRDWLGRTNPDLNPTHGFFPVWAACLFIISGKCYFMIVIF